jgi:hypothetical protein
VAYVTPIGSSPDQIEYRLGRAHGCGDRQFAYHADARERPLVWVGQGLPEVGLTPGAELTESQFDAARALMNGLQPHTGARLVEHKVAVHADAKVALGPLVRAVHAAATERGVPVATVLGDNPVAATAFARAERAVTARGDGATLRADAAGRIANAAGIPVYDVWGAETFATAVANLTEMRTVTAPDGTASQQLVPRRMVVGNLGYDVSFTLPKSYSLLLAFADEPTTVRAPVSCADPRVPGRRGAARPW